MLRGERARPTTSGVQRYGRRCALAGLALLMVWTAYAPVAQAAGWRGRAHAGAAATVWLCRPGLARDPCRSSLTATVVPGSGATSVQPARPAGNPAVDCFYVYPTVSVQPTLNANLHVDPEERAIAVIQASRFSQVCRVYAPMYPQFTLTAVGGPLADAARAGRRAYSGVLSAWRDYLAHYNHGRGVVLIGHSQGSFVLTHLVRSQIDPQPVARRRLVSALLPGASVTVPVGRDVGGDFKHVRACRDPDQTGCVVAYASFDRVPPVGTLFGRVSPLTQLVFGSVAGRNLRALCVNPSALAGGTGTLVPYFTTMRLPGPYAEPLPAIPTPWASFPKLYTARCERANGADWLRIRDVGRPRDPRPRVAATLGPFWGLHFSDVNLALGNLVSLVRRQATAYLRGK
jgi:DUF3089 family protein